MKVLLSWLREYVDLPFSVDELTERFPMLGLSIDAVDVLGGDDAVFDLEIPANRGDLMSMVGVAREIAAAARSSLRPPAGEIPPDQPAMGERGRVEVQTPELCPRFTATLTVDVHVGPSPSWMARRLEACGVRSINNVVDVTNYVMLELGQPMHAFDYDRLDGGRLVVRLAHKGETMTTLDGVPRSLDAQTLVVADARRPAGIAGIIGGAASEISPATRQVLLEAAFWHPAMIRRTSRRLGVRTESSARFERGTDPASLPAVQARALQLMQQVAGGRVPGGMSDVSAQVVRPRRLELRWAKVARLLGMEVPMQEGTAILRSLGFEVARTDDLLHVTVPTFRRDVELEEDLVEEVARHYGYERIPETMPVEVTAQGTRAPMVDAERAVRELMVRIGLTEAITISLTNPATLDSLQLPPDHPLRQAIRLRNPLVEDHVLLRTSLLPGLLRVAQVNASHRVTDVQVFEVGRTFHLKDGQVDERRRLALLMTGQIMRGAWNLPAEAVAISFYHLKGAVETLLAGLRIGGAVLTAAPSPWLHPGRCAEFMLDGQVVATAGEVHGTVAAAYDLTQPTYVAEVDLETLLARAVLRPQFMPLPKFPSARRDISLIVRDDVMSAQVEQVIREAAGSLLEGLEAFDVYTGRPIPTHHRNLAYALTFRSLDRTLTADEVAQVVAQIIKALKSRLRAKVRE